MKRNRSDKEYIRFLEQRLQHLEEINRFTPDALEMAASLGDFQSSINKLRSTEVILDETAARIQSLIPFAGVTFLLVDEATHDFLPVFSKPENFDTLLQNEVAFLIDRGIFSWILRERKPVMVTSKDGSRKLILHVMATSSRIRGMFVGCLDQQVNNISDIFRSLLSIILLNSSNALESFELYKTIREISETLEKRENYRILFEAAPDGVEVLDAKGTIIDCNQTQELMLGYRREEMVGNPADHFLSLQANAVFAGQTPLGPETDYVEGEVEMVRADGTLLPVWRKGRAIYTDAKELVGWVIYNRDISLAKKAEEEKKDLQIHLQRAKNMEAIGALAGGVAHDLNNILGGLISYPELLYMRLPEDSPLRSYVRNIQKSGEKAAAIVQDLLTLARREVAVEEVVNLNQIVAEYLATPEHEKLSALHPRVYFECDLEEHLLNMMGSPIHLSKTLMNLVLNAAEAMPGGGVVTISTRNRYLDRPLRGYEELTEGDYVTLTVSDTGMGISAEDMDRIFEPFYTKKVMGKSGTGLGLAVVWGTVKDHKGYIDLKSKKGKGSTFNLYFPVSRKDLILSEAPPEATNWNGNGERILVVDDIPEQREIATTILRSLGYHAASAASGEEAIAYLKDHSADLLILDMIMEPGMDGLETYRRLLEFRPLQKALIVSGYSETDRVREALLLGAGGYVKKPYLLQTISLAVRKELNRDLFPVA
ncbi:MAG: response regulator [Deltaproteobacteria bacterium]|nr:response regulator [Deltaproteobacteria bacterium]